mgnify:FL=1
MSKTIQILKKVDIIEGFSNLGKKLVHQMENEVIKFKAYKITELPKGFDKDKNRWFNQSGLTYIENSRILNK